MEAHKEALLVLLRPALARALLEAEADHVTCISLPYGHHGSLHGSLHGHHLFVEAQEDDKGHHGSLHLATTMSGDAATLRSIWRCPRLIGSV